MARKIILNPDDWVSRYTREDLLKLAWTLKQRDVKRCDRNDLALNFANAYLVWDLLEEGEPGEKILHHLRTTIKRIKKPSHNNYRIRAIARFMYEIKYEDLPLYIDREEFLTKSILRWRLDIGK